jgi:endonuclease/exonuclease/phosphatase family metal-dependent hydrolase
VATTIRATSPDIVCLQEVEVNHAHQQTRLWSTAHFDNQPALLAEQTGLTHHAFAECIKCVATGTLTKGKERHNKPECHGSFGVAILSRYPILDQKILTFTKYKKKTKRNALAVLVAVDDGSKIWVVCTHLGCHSGPEQYAQALELLPFLSSLAADPAAAGVILAGDTNSPPFFNAIKHLKKNGMTDTWETNGSGSCGTTFPALGWPCCYSWTCCPPLLKLDYIMFQTSSTTTSRKIECDASWVVQDGDSENAGADAVDLNASDHRPLAAIFRVTGVVLDDVNVLLAGGATGVK